MNQNELKVRGARHHNLKNINVNIPKNKIVVIIQMMNMDSTFPVNEFSINLGSTANSDTPNRLYLL